MFLHTKHGVIVRLPKLNGEETLEGYRPISLLNTDYRILARILAHSLRPVLENHLQTSQFCCVPDNSILEEVPIVSEEIAQSEITNTHLCVFTWAFQNTFDEISHRYHFQVLRSYRISPWFIERIKSLYEKTMASMQINVNIAGPIPIQSAVRQCCR
jgi:hypothetical protein